MRSLVVDASVAIKWLNPAEPLADKANAIRCTVCTSLGCMHGYFAQHHIR